MPWAQTTPRWKYNPFFETDYKDSDLCKDFISYANKSVTYVGAVIFEMLSSLLRRLISATTLQ
jgi:hypothetical protein